MRFKQFLRLIIHSIDILWPNLWLISGIEISSNQQLAILYAGNKIDKEFIAHLAFKGACEERHIGRQWLWKVVKAMNNKDSHFSLVIMEAPKILRKLFGNNKHFYIPCWTTGEVDISGDISSFLKNASLNSDVRRIRKNGLTYEVTRERQQFLNFYHHMYMPYVMTAHSNEAFIMGYEDMAKRYLDCDLLLVKEKGVLISGTLIVYSKNKAGLWSVGVKDGNASYVKEGALSALFYFSVCYLKERGYKKVNFGESRAFLKDGVAQFKKKWRQRITGVSGAGFLFMPLALSKGLKGFFMNNPFIYVEKNRLVAAVFEDENNSFSKEDGGESYRKYFYDGVTQINVYRFNGDTAQRDFSPILSEKISICSAMK